MVIWVQLALLTGCRVGKIRGSGGIRAKWSKQVTLNNLEQILSEY